MAPRRASLAPAGEAARRLAGLLGPAFVAAVAYVDPGNVAANVSAGARYGYLLLWVLVAANVIAMLVQYLSAKLGIVTGHSLPELLGESLSRPARLAFWLQAEIVAVATDFAEVVGGALALQLLWGVPLLAGGAIVALLSLLILGVQTLRHQRAFERLIEVLLVVITTGFLGGLLVVPLHWPDLAAGFIPRLRGTDTVVLAASMLGATVMPHAIYLHSALARDRHGHSPSPSRQRELLRATGVDVVAALFLAGGTNIGMLVLAAAALRGVPGTDTIEGAQAAMTAHIGPVVGAVFAVGLLASGLASTAVGAYAGSEIMQGLLHWRVSPLVRRSITVIPALVIIALGVEPTTALIVSQVVLSLGIPLALIPLVRYTGSARMGRWRNTRAMRLVAVAATAVVVALNAVLVFLALSGSPL